MTKPRPFRFAYGQARAASRAEWIEEAKRAEDNGYATFHVPDHLGALSPTVALQSVAEQTSLRIGHYVLNNDFRNPVLVAQEASTLDLLSDGRLELGLGAGWNIPEYEAAGIPFDRAPVRIRRLDESAQILRRLFAGEEVTFEGEFYTVRDHTQAPLPPQGGELPLLIGGNGDKLLSVAARHATIVGITGFTIRPEGPQLTHFGREALAERIEFVRERAGERADDLEFNILVQRCEVGRDRTTIADEWAAEDGAQLSAEEIHDSPFMLAGTVDQVVDELSEMRERTGASYITVLGRRAQGFEAVVERLAGR